MPSYVLSALSQFSGYSVPVKCYRTTTTSSELTCYHGVTETSFFPVPITHSICCICSDSGTQGVIGSTTWQYYSITSNITRRNCNMVLFAIGKTWYQLWCAYSRARRQRLELDINIDSTERVDYLARPLRSQLIWSCVQTLLSARHSYSTLASGYLCRLSSVVALSP